MEEKVKLTPEQEKEIAERYLAKQAKAAKQKEAEKATYEKRKERFVMSSFNKLQKLSEQMNALKNKIFEDAAELIESKNELYKVKNTRRSDTFTSIDGKISIKLGNRMLEGWSDEAEIGIQKVKQYLESLSKDEETSMLVSTVMGLLAKDQKGTLKASKVLELKRIASKNKNPLFLEGIELISNAYRPKPSCDFIEVRYKDARGVERSLPLSMAAMDLKDEPKEDAK